jgi:hypothetical protein
LILPSLIIITNITLKDETHKSSQVNTATAGSGKVALVGTDTLMADLMDEELNYLTLKL